ncbi:MAG: CHASE4 domain-containing protein [Acidobacteriota bacterium]
MSLRLKAWLVFLAAMSVVVGGVLWLLDATLLASFARFEEGQVRRDAERLVHAIQAEAGHLDTVATDWAQWDDSYEYMESGSPDYAESNLGESTFQTLGLSVLAYVRPSGEIVYGQQYYRTSEELVPLPETTAGMLAAEAASDHFRPIERGVRGLCRLQGVTNLVAARRILRGDGSGPSRGLLVMCRPFDREMVAHLAQALDLDVSIQPIPVTESTSTASHVPFLRDSGSRITILPPGPETIAAEVELVDIHGAPALALQIVEPRTITDTGEAVSRLVSVSLLAALILAGLAAQLILERGVLRRLAALDGDLQRVAATRDLSLRVGARGSDEVARLARGINATLGALEAAEATLRDSEERYRAIVEERTEFICRWRPDGTIIFANQPLYELLAVAPGEPIHQHFPNLAAPEQAGRHPVGLDPTPAGPAGEFVHGVTTRQGVTRWIQWHTVALSSANGEPQEYQSVGRDITEQRITQERLRDAERRASEELGAPAEIALLTDPGGSILAATEATAARLERGVSNVRDSHVEDLLGTEGAHEWRFKVEAATSARASVRWDGTIGGRTFELVVLPAIDDQGRVRRYATIGRDVTDQRRAEVAERRLAAASARRTVLEGVARDLEAQARSGQAVLDRFADLTAAETTSLCAIYLLASDGQRLLPVTLRSSSTETAHRLAHRRPLRARRCSRGPVCDAVAAMEPLELAGEPAREVVSALLPEVEPFLSHLGPLFVRLTPIVVAGRAAGLLAAVREVAGTPYSDEDHEFLDEIAGRAALAIGQVTLYDELQYELRERARVEEALRDARRVFLEVSRSMRGVLWIREVQSNSITYVSPGWEHVWGQSSDSLYRDAALLLAGVHPDDRPAVAADLVAARPTPDRVMEFRVVRPDGEVRWVVARQVHLAGSDASQDKVFGMAEDVTERKSVEERSRQLDAKLRQLARRLDEAREEERRELATWIHDEIGQMLTALRLDLAWIHKRIPEADEETLAAVTEMEQLIDRNVNAVQRVATELRPTMIDDFGLAATIEWELERFERRTGILCTLEVTAASAPVRPAAAHVFYQVFREALTNVARHADATEVTVMLGQDPDGTVTLSVADDGRGIRDSDLSGLGILGMRERVSAASGRLEVSPGDSGGTTITVKIPPK